MAENETLQGLKLMHCDEELQENKGISYSSELKMQNKYDDPSAVV